MRECVELHGALEVCPTSYPPLGVVADLAAIPVRALLAAGVPAPADIQNRLLAGIATWIAR